MKRGPMEFSAARSINFVSVGSQQPSLMLNAILESLLFKTYSIATECVISSIMLLDVCWHHSENDLRICLRIFPLMTIQASTTKMCIFYLASQPIVFVTQAWQQQQREMKRRHHREKIINLCFADHSIFIFFSLLKVEQII